MTYDYKADITGVGNRSLTNLDYTSAHFPSVLDDYNYEISIFVNINSITSDTFLYSS